MSATGDALSRGIVYYRQTKEVVAYSEDLHVWVYYDQTDDILRYEAYVIDYDDAGSPSTLAFVIDDGILSWASPLGQYLTKKSVRSPGAKQSLWAIPRHTRSTLAAPELNLYLQLSEKEIHAIHRLFASEESRLKAKHRSTWVRRLQALGYDVIPSAF
ncbi:MAG: hypothetical protein GX998_04940 [Firmicutes bacterium]|nr:hypothetical protein [Bacillota bacterium]